MRRSREKNPTCKLKYVDMRLATHRQTVRRSWASSSVAKKRPTGKSMTRRDASRSRVYLGLFFAVGGVCMRGISPDFDDVYFSPFGLDDIL